MSVNHVKRVMLVAAVIFVAACGKSAAPPVSFSADVKPILDQYCLECHTRESPGYAASGFSVENYEDLMKGTKFGPTVIAGDAFNSNLMILIEGRADPTIAMPHDGTKVYTAHAETPRTWIEQGAPNN